MSAGLVEYWENRIREDVDPRIEAFSDKERRFYDCIVSWEEKRMAINDPVDAIRLCPSDLDKEDSQKVWDVYCIMSNFKNNLFIAKYAQEHPEQVRALGEYIDGPPGLSD